MCKVKVWVASFAAMACGVSAMADGPSLQTAELAREIQIAAIAPAVMGPDGKG